MCKLSWRDRQRRTDYASSWSNGDLCQVSGEILAVPTTLFDYIRRAMPFPSPKSLSDEDVYSVTAFILYCNGLIKEKESIDANSLPRLAMPGRDNLTDLWAKQGEKPY
jgi:S-disulfanyl-L-cysteine oxidoreductase SoxD